MCVLVCLEGSLGLFRVTDRSAPLTTLRHPAVDLQEALRHAEAELSTLHFELEARLHETHEVKRQERNWRVKCAEHASALGAQREDLRDIASNATRQYRVRFRLLQAALVPQAYPLSAPACQ